jgi:cytochrome c
VIDVATGMRGSNQVILIRHPGIGSALAMIGALAGALPAAAQTANGTTLYNQRCKVCHSVVANAPSPTGPNLRGIVGRKAGLATYNYSAAMKKSNLVWTKATLDKYLAGPTKSVPGTKMVIAVADAKQRAAIIDYLATQK